MENFIHFFDLIPTGDNPLPFTWSHVILVLITLVVTILVTVTLGRKHSPKIDTMVVFSFGLFLLIFEAFKQGYLLYAEYVVHGLTYDTNDLPFQFCDIPMYVGFIIPFVKNKKVKDALFGFLAFFGLVAGIATIAMPSGLFDKLYWPIVCHSCIWHILMVVVGVYLLASREYAKSVKDFTKEFLPAFWVFLTVTAIALVLDIVFYYTLGNYGADINFFYISPFNDCPLPILHDIRAILTGYLYPFFLLIYAFAFGAGCSVIWFISFGLRAKYRKRRRNN